MIQEKDIFRCSVCGNIIEVVSVGGGTLVCCGKEMAQLEAKQTEEGNEKHVPVMMRDGNIVRVHVGSIDHPMEDAHYIQWIELITNIRIMRVHLKPYEAPEAEFCLFENETIQFAREYCNIHGLWKKQ